MRPFVAVDARALDLPLEAVPGDQVVAGAPATGAVPVGEFGGVRVGVWEMTAGGMRDVEIDEVFVVLEGEATVELREGDAEAASLDLRPGVVVRLEAGMTTVWTVPDRLRKLYLAP